MLMQQQQSVKDVQARDVTGGDKAKCPVPRPILNILMNRRSEANLGSSVENSNPTPRTGQDKERQWVTTQLAVFKDSYQNIPGYEAAEAYLECILSLATGGVESDRVSEARLHYVFENNWCSC